eukprot:COSAG01_NODE_129_length_24935_cov_39.324368_8_plen_72_part_00
MLVLKPRAENILKNSRWHFQSNGLGYLKTNHTGSLLRKPLEELKTSKKIEMREFGHHIPRTRHSDRLCLQL